LARLRRGTVAAFGLSWFKALTTPIRANMVGLAECRDQDPLAIPAPCAWSPAAISHQRAAAVSSRAGIL